MTQNQMAELNRLREQRVTWEIEQLRDRLVVDTVRRIKLEPPPPPELLPEWESLLYVEADLLGEMPREWREEWLDPAHKGRWMRKLAAMDLDPIPHEILMIWEHMFHLWTGRIWTDAREAVKSPA